MYVKMYVSGKLENNNINIKTICCNNNLACEKFMRCERAYLFSIHLLTGFLVSCIVDLVSLDSGTNFWKVEGWQVTRV